MSSLSHPLFLSLHLIHEENLERGKLNVLSLKSWKKRERLCLLFEINIYSFDTIFYSHRHHPQSIILFSPDPALRAPSFSSLVFFFFYFPLLPVLFRFPFQNCKLSFNRLAIDIVYSGTKLKSSLSRKREKDK